MDVHDCVCLYRWWRTVTHKKHCFASPLSLRCLPANTERSITFTNWSKTNYFDPKGQGRMSDIRRLRSWTRSQSKQSTREWDHRRILTNWCCWSGRPGAVLNDWTIVLCAPTKSILCGHCFWCVFLFVLTLFRYQQSRLACSVVGFQCHCFTSRRLIAAAAAAFFFLTSSKGLKINCGVSPLLA